MKQEQLREYYISDLLNIDALHGRTTPKTKHIKMWEQLRSFSQTGTFKNLNEHTGKLWVWSDQHFGHKNIIKYTGRPFVDHHEMTTEMIARYNATVSPEDVVIFVGDFGFMPVGQLNQILYSLPGYKILIIGNHDLDRKKRE